MRVIIAGSRDLTNYIEFKKYVDKCTSDMNKFNTPITTVLSGKCEGVDLMGERYAKENNIPVEEYPADWGRYGNKAGPIRNSEMVDNANCLILYWDGRSNGSSDVRLKAIQKELIIYDNQEERF